jgi:Tol biopolymer transport system component
MVAFVSEAGGTPQVWIKNLATGDPVQLTFDDIPASRPRWSAQGDRIVYSRVGNGIWSVPSLGGEPRQIIRDGRNPDLSRDGRRLVFERAGEVFMAGTDGSDIFAHQYQAGVDRRQRMAVYSSVEHGALQQSRLRDLETGSDTRLPFALYEQRFSRNGRLIAGESRDHQLLICEVSGRCRHLTPKSDRGLTALAWSADDTRLFFLRHTSKRVWGELTSISVDGGAEKLHGLVGPFEHDFQMFMDVSPRDEIVFALCREGPYESWMATLR